MLTEKDIKWFKKSQRRIFRVILIVPLIGCISLFACGYWNIHMAYRLKACRNLDFVVASDIDMDAEYSGAHFIAQRAFYTGLYSVATGIFLTVMVWVAISYIWREQRFLKFIKEHSPEEVRQLLGKDTD